MATPVLFIAPSFDITARERKEHQKKIFELGTGKLVRYLEIIEDRSGPRWKSDDVRAELSRRGTLERAD